MLHRTVIAEVIGSDGKWTLVKQASDRQDAGQIVSPIGGHVQAGETIEDALKREANEEYGITGDFQFQLIGKKIFDREVLERYENHLFVLFEIYTDNPPKLNEEAVAFERFTKEELKSEVHNNWTNLVQHFISS
ncbi:MAG: NUDIX hydrolase [Patescibacteria group bacterium]